jgi:hypothetical protein
MQVQRDNPNYAQPVSGSGSGGNLKTILIMVALAAVVSWGVAQFWVIPSTVSKADFTTNIQSMDTRVKTAQAAAETAAKDIKAIVIPSMSGYLTTQQLKDALKDYTLTKDLTKAVDTTPFALKTDLTGLAAKTDIESLQKQIDALKSGTSGSGGTGATTGAVTVSLDTSTPAQFNGANPVTVKVNINNGTNQYQYVSYFVNMSAVTSPSFAATNVTATMSLMTYDKVLIPASGNTSQILLTPTGKILVPPGTTSCYYLITISPSNQAVWQVGISNITYSTTP